MRIRSMYGLFTYIRNQPNVGKNIPYMDPMGWKVSGNLSIFFPIAPLRRQVAWAQLLVVRLHLRHIFRATSLATGCGGKAWENFERSSIGGSGAVEVL